MALREMNQNIQDEFKIGGSRPVIEGHPSVLTGGFNFDVADLPDKGAVLPIATPVNCDEEARTIKPTYTFAIAEAAEAAATEYKVKKGGEGTRVKVGMVLGIAPESYTDKFTGVTVSKVDTSNETFDVITVSATLGAAEVGAILIEGAEEDETTIKVIPNALLDRDVRKAPGAKGANGDGIFLCDSPILENRIPPIPACLKKALLDNGCFIRFSNRK